MRLKVILISAVFTAAMLAAYSVVLVQAASSWHGEVSREKISGVSGRLVLAIEHAGRSGMLPEGEELIALLRKELRKHVADDQGWALALTEGETGRERMLASLGRWPAGGALTGREAVVVAGADGQPRKLRLKVAAPAQSFGSVVEIVYAPLLVAAAVTLVLGVVMLACMNTVYLRPIMALRRATREVSEGEIGVDIDVRSGDELQELAESFSGMLDRLAEMQDLALDANPLTGLPGNATIQRFIESGIEQERTWSVVYVDLDNFKAYNDVYGFEAGDRAILLVAELLTEVCPAHDSEAFVGHIGGDDFLFAVESGLARQAAGEIIREFDLRVGELYSPEDRERGYVISKDRQHQEQRFGLMALSMGCVDTGARKFSHFSELAAAAAELKGQAKKQPGSVFLVDRRKP